jgi:corrinoid protein of di/trimethylamine methyltransferase
MRPSRVVTMPELTEIIREAMLAFEPEKLTEAVKKSLKEGCNPLEIIDAIIVVLGEIGDKFQKGELFLTHLAIAGEAAKNTISEYLEPSLKKAKTKRKTVGRVVIGTVAGDIHDIGKSIVATMLFSEGFDVKDLGTDVSVEEFVKAVKEYSPDIVGMSALLTTILPMQKDVIEALKEHNLSDKVKVIIGGAPVTAEWAKEIGADGYAEDAIEAVKVVKKLVEDPK